MDLSNFFYMRNDMARYQETGLPRQTIAIICLVIGSNYVNNIQCLICS